ncbi:MAG: chemotaxis protein CheA [Pseudomonadota bacterium]
MDDTINELRESFLQESEDQIDTLEEGLLQLERGGADADIINAVFRAAHTIKGAAGVIGCGFVESFMHGVENTLDLLRARELEVSPPLIGVLLKCADHIKALVGLLAINKEAPEPEMVARGRSLSDELNAFIHQPGETQKRDQLPSHSHSSVETLTDDGVAGDCWHISVRFGTEVLRQGMDPVSFLRYLTTLGDILSIETLADAMPPEAGMDPESCYLGFEINLESQTHKAAIEKVFAFVQDDCFLRILPPHSKLSEFVQLIRELPEDPMRIGEILVQCGALTDHELAEALMAQKFQEASPEATETVETPAGSLLGEILVGQHAIQRELVDAAAAKQAQSSEKRASEAKMIRVQADKLDYLITLVGELVIAGASTHLLAQRSNVGELSESTSLLSRLVEEIRDSALQLRMVQIGETFNRFHRVVRDVSRERDKDIEFLIKGGETELDKSVVERIGDPLMHLIRNAIDHGIEPAQIRVQRGKSPKGRLELNAFHESGNIIIEVSDDGGGLNHEKILAKALDKGLVQPGQHLSDTEIANLIFEPGFSTSEVVTNLSGRGVGMDVVKRNIEALRGSVEVLSEEGYGTRFIIRLPLTLAIIDGFLVGVAQASYVIPLDFVLECIELEGVAAGTHYINLRGEVLPFLHLRELFGIGGQPPKRESVVVVQCFGAKAGLVVDTLFGEFQTVIKPLGNLFRQLKGVSGSTILGSGDVALILDVQSLVNIVSGREERRMRQIPWAESQREQRL